MPETTFLQIEGRDQSSTRMLEMPSGPVRIGRGSHCEVRLQDDPGLGDVQCLLRRRGTHWHFQPVGPPGHVWIDGRPADQQRPLPVGSSLRVGDHWLTLRSTSDAGDARGSFASPITVEPRVEPAPAAERARPSASPTPPPGPAPAPAAPTADDEDRLRRWQTRLEQRERWLKSRQDERTWEARWKAAGETIRGRSATPPPPARSTPAPPPPAPNRPAPAPAPIGPAPGLERRPMPRPAERLVDPRPATPLTRPAEPTRPAAPARVPVRPATAPAPPRPMPVAPAPAPVRDLAPAPAPIPAPVPIPAAPMPPAVEPVPTLLPEPAPVAAVIEPVGPVAKTTALVIVPEPEPIAANEPIEAAFEEPEAVDSVIEAEPAASLLEVEADEFEVPVEEAPEPELSPEPIVAYEPAPEPEPPFAPRPAAALIPEADWPSAQAIFAGRSSRALTPAATAAVAARSARPGPTPTRAVAPAQWRPPLWATWLPASAVALVLSAAGLGLAWAWTMDALGMNEAVRLALRAEGTPAPAIAPEAIPRPRWWETTPNQLAAWAVAVERSSPGGARSDAVRGLAEDARHASALGASARFALRPDDAPAPAEDGTVAVGRSRDVVSLAWTGRSLKKAGKPAPALGVFRTAFDIAGRSAGLPPTFDEARQPRRYALRHEAILAWVAGQMAAAGPWTADEWAGVLPPFAPAWVAAAQAVRAGDRPLAETLVGKATAVGRDPAGFGFGEAEHRAGGAEALVQLSRWPEAAEAYRRAIDAEGDARARRIWSINLAEIEGRAGNESARTAALESAIEAGAEPDAEPDDITKRARKALGLTGVARKDDRPR